MATTEFEVAREGFHAALLASGTLSVDAHGVASIADRKNPTSVAIAGHITAALKVGTPINRLAGQSSGTSFEIACKDFLRETFPKLDNIRPGDWHVHKVGGRGKSAQVAVYEQYEHLAALDAAVKANPALRTILGNAYAIAPDVVVTRAPVADAIINRNTLLVDSNIALHTPIREVNQKRHLLHAVVSCKWTIRSDRSQNSRSEALNLMRNRKGRLPHVVVVTAEPLPSRIASIALGTGDIDCTYHFALNELITATRAVAGSDTVDLLEVMIEGKRLRDISDLPLDLAT